MIEERGTDMAVVEMVTGIDLLLAERVRAEDNHSRGRKEDPHLLQRDIQTAVERNLDGQVKGEKAMEDQEIGVKGLQTGGIAMVVPDLLTEGRVLVIIGAGVKWSTIEVEILAGVGVSEITVEVESQEDILRPEGLIVRILTEIKQWTVIHTPETRDTLNQTEICMGTQAVGVEMEGGIRNPSIDMDHL